ncbi:hypothetical protein KAT08_01450 [Candidatus Babeliales bacterium]|nr:hypothetical protein [Candidatus Babeliales bacterium]
MKIVKIKLLFTSVALFTAMEMIATNDIYYKVKTPSINLISQDNKSIRMPIRVLKQSKEITYRVKKFKKGSLTIDINSDTLQDMVDFMVKTHDLLEKNYLNVSNITQELIKMMKKKIGKLKFPATKLILKDKLPEKFNKWIRASGLMQTDFITKALAQLYLKWSRLKNKNQLEKAIRQLPAHLFEETAKLFPLVRKKYVMIEDRKITPTYLEIIKFGYLFPLGIEILKNTAKKEKLSIDEKDKSNYEIYASLMEKISPEKIREVYKNHPKTKELLNLAKLNLKYLKNIMKQIHSEITLILRRKEFVNDLWMSYPIHFLMHLVPVLIFGFKIKSDRKEIISNFIDYILGIPFGEEKKELEIY